MSKFLLILLIAVATSITVEFDETELNGWYKSLFSKHIYDRLIEQIKKFINWLKEEGYWDKLVDLIEKYGAPKAYEFCEENLSGQVIRGCKNVVDYIIKYGKNVFGK